MKNNALIDNFKTWLFEFNQSKLRSNKVVNISKSIKFKQNLTTNVINETKRSDEPNEISIKKSLKSWTENR